jgi:hypothetical protein
MVRFWKVFKKIVLFTGIGIVVLSLIAMLLTYIYEDDLKAMAVKEVNRNLRAKVLIKGADIHLTFFSTFPNAAIQFENFRILEPGSSAVLAQAAVLNFQFSPLDFINGEYHIHRILLKDAEVHLKINENGDPNYLILKPDTLKQKGAATPLDIQLQSIRLKNVKLTYDDEKEDLHIALSIKNSAFAGSFTDARYDLSTSADLFAEQVSFGNKNFLSKKNIGIDASLDIDNQKKKYAIRNFKLKLDKSIFSAKGSVSQKDDGYLTDLGLNGEDGSIQTIISLLPNNISAVFKDYRSNGQINFDGTINGMASRFETPAIHFNFKIINATIKDDKHAMGLEQVNLSGNFDNGKSHSLQSSSLHLDQFHASLHGREITARFILDNFKDPSADIYLKSNINLGDLKNFITIPGIENMAGDMPVDASFKGKFADLKQYSTVSRTKLSGTVELKNVSVKPAVQQFAYSALNGHFETDGNDLVIHDFSGTFGHTDFKLNGEFKNLASFLFLPGQNLKAVATLESRYIDLDDFVAGGTSKQSGKETAQRFDLPVFLAFVFRVQAGRVSFGRFEAENVSGQLQMQEKAAAFQNVVMKTMSGTVSMNGTIADAGAAQIKTTAHLVLKGIDVKKMFYEMGNFGQTYFTDKYIQGKLDAVVDYSSNWNKDLTADPGSIVAIADITIYDGEIHKFPQFMALGKFLKVKSLDDISFSEYTNRIYIRNKVVEIPKMDIKSSAVNMSLAGTHTFENVMDYKMKVNMSQLLFGNKKSYEDEFGEVEVDENGGMNVFLTMTGPVDNYKIRYDTKSSIKNVGKGLQQEKVEMQKIFKENSPNKIPGEDLNKTTNELELNTDKQDAQELNLNDQDPDAIPPVKKSKPQDSARKKAFENFKKKLNKTH